MNQNLIIALFCNDKSELSYVCFEMRDRRLIEQFLVSISGKAISYVPSDDCRYWLLLSDVNKGFLLFGQDDNCGFTDISKSEIDYKHALYLASL